MKLSLDPFRQLDPFQQWMVKSNLEAIQREERTADQAIANLKAGGYEMVAAAVEKVWSQCRNHEQVS